MNELSWTCSDQEAHGEALDSLRDEAARSFGSGWSTNISRESRSDMGTLRDPQVHSDLSNKRKKNSPEVAHSSGTSKACMYVDIVLKCASILKGWSHPKAQRLCIADSTSRKLASASPSCCSRYWGWNLGMKQAVAGLCSAKAGPDAAAAQCVQGTHPNSGGVALEEGPPMSGHSCTENHHQVEKHHKQWDYNVFFFFVYIYIYYIYYIIYIYTHVMHIEIPHHLHGGHWGKQFEPMRL